MGKTSLISPYQLHQILDEYRTGVDVNTNNFDGDSNCTIHHRETRYENLEMKEGNITLHSVRVEESIDGIRKCVGEIDYNSNPSDLFYTFTRQTPEGETQECVLKSSVGDDVFGKGLIINSLECSSNPELNTKTEIKANGELYTDRELADQLFHEISAAIFAMVCPEDMVYIPSRYYLVGNSASSPDEAPERLVFQPPTCINQHEVTNDEYHDFFPKTRELPSPYNKPDQPRVFIPWSRAESYCKMRYTNGGLPNEWTWEIAARAGRSGDEHATLSGKMGPQEARMSTRKERATEPAVPVESHGPNPFGLYDMAGNVKEWTSSPYDPHYLENLKHGAMTYADPQGPSPGKTVRGGSYRNNVEADMRPTNRMYLDGETAEDDLGFRCVAQVLNRGWNIDGIDDDLKEMATKSEQAKNDVVKYLQAIISETDNPELITKDFEGTHSLVGMSPQRDLRRLRAFYLYWRLDKDNNLHFYDFVKQQLPIERELCNADPKRSRKLLEAFELVKGL